MQVIVRIILSVVFALSVGLVLGGAWLKILGGTWYYVGIGLLYCLATYLLFKQKALGAWLCLLALIVTIPWALWESDQQYWGRWL
jgi:quinoprotein glucose dehydrogenase